jgi:hypothetical protein
LRLRQKPTTRYANETRGVPKDSFKWANHLEVEGQFPFADQPPGETFEPSKESIKLIRDSEDWPTARLVGFLLFGAPASTTQ